MPRRILNGEKVWNSSKLAQLPDHYALAYAYLYPLALADGTFEADPEEVFVRAFARRKTWKIEDVAEILTAFERVGVLERRTAPDGKIWGKWTASEKELPTGERIDHLNLAIGKGHLFNTKDLSTTEQLCSTYVVPTQQLRSEGVREGKGRVGLISSDLLANDVEEAFTEAHSDVEKGIVSNVEVTQAGRDPVKLYAIIAEIWSNNYPGAVCKKPHKRGWAWWSDECAATPPETLIRAFTLWAQQYGDSKNDVPIYTFLKEINLWRDKVIEEKKGQVTPEQTEAEKQSEAAAIEAWRLDHIELKTTEELLAEQNKDADAPDDFMRMLREQV